jgi:hypothetical protein
VLGNFLRCFAFSNQIGYTDFLMSQLNGRRESLSERGDNAHEIGFDEVKIAQYLDVPDVSFQMINGWYDQLFDI